MIEILFIISYYTAIIKKKYEVSMKIDIWLIYLIYDER